MIKQSKRSDSFRAFFVLFCAEHINRGESEAIVADENANVEGYISTDVLADSSLQAPSNNISNEKDYMASIKAARKAASSAQKDYESRVKAAKSAIAKAENEHESAIKKARKAYEEKIREEETILKKIEKAYAEKIGSFAGITLYNNRVVFGRVSIPLVDVSQVEITDTVGKDEEFRLNIIIKSNSETIAQDCAPEKEAQAREFADRIRKETASARINYQAYQRDVSDAKARIKAAKKDTSAVSKAEKDTDAIKDAKKKLAEVEADLDEVYFTKRHIATLEAGATPSQRVAMAEFDAKKKAKNRKLLAVGIVILIAVVAAATIVLSNVLGK